VYNLPEKSVKFRYLTPKNNIYGAGICRRKGEWILSIYKNYSDSHLTIKIKRIKPGVI
jgi:hypothetical protein